MFQDFRPGKPDKPKRGPTASWEADTARAKGEKEGRFKIPLLIRRVVGHSMVPILPPKTLVFGLRYFRKLKPGEVVVVEHEGLEKIKRIDQIENDQVFLLGDHPETSTDSRHFGWLPLEAIKAKIVWPRTRPE
ncbi:MAG TPA: nickel-type superoxide dismutase maturation protease [Patescibacteria group bacterium]|nr:nickel-type superoxide dismutase maturation protease [Patescibacteria group bacterium]